MLELVSIRGDVYAQDEVLVDVILNGKTKRLLVKSEDAIALSRVSPPKEVEVGIDGE